MLSSSPARERYRGRGHFDRRGSYTGSATFIPGKTPHYHWICSIETSHEVKMGTQIYSRKFSWILLHSSFSSSYFVSLVFNIGCHCFFVFFPCFPTRAGMRFTARSVSSWWTIGTGRAGCKAGPFFPSVLGSSPQQTSSWRSVVQ